MGTWWDLPEVLQLKGVLISRVPILKAVERVAQNREVFCRAACWHWGHRGHFWGVHRSKAFTFSTPASYTYDSWV